MDVVNHSVRDGAGKLVYRTVEYGDWEQGQVGDEWAIQFRWPDGHVETELKPSRERAEHAAANHNRNRMPSQAVVVSRTVRCGDWWLAATAQAPGHE